jgi:hypothetical protein
MVVTRDAFRTLGAADDPDSTVPCQLQVRVCELDGGEFRRTKGSTTAFMLRQEFRVCPP